MFCFTSNFHRIRLNLYATQTWTSRNHGDNILRLFDTLPIFFSPPVKRSVIISNKHGIYELPHELPNDLRLRILGN